MSDIADTAGATAVDGFSGGDAHVVVADVQEELLRCASVC